MKALSHCAPTAPSMTLWSQDSVALMMVLALKGEAAPGVESGTTLRSAAPMARMADCGRQGEGRRWERIGVS